VPKTLFLDIVAKLNAAGINSLLIPSKIEGLTFGQDVMVDGVRKHTLFVANDNDFLPMVADPFKLPSDPSRGLVPNPNQWYVFAFDDTDLPGYACGKNYVRSAPPARCTFRGPPPWAAKGNH